MSSGLAGILPVLPKTYLVAYRNQQKIAEETQAKLEAEQEAEALEIEAQQEQKTDQEKPVS